MGAGGGAGGAVGGGGRGANAVQPMDVDQGQQVSSAAAMGTLSDILWTRRLTKLGDLGSFTP
jgi:hypothetical protein